MSKRHTDIVTGEVLPDGIRFYAPLASEGDFSDHVSGVVPVVNTNMISWDSAKNAYLFTCTTNDRQGLAYHIVGVNNYSPNYRCTILAKIFVVTQNATSEIISVGTGGHVEGEGPQNTSCASLLETHRYSGFTTNAWHTICYTYGTSGNTINFYMDGEVVRTDTGFPTLRPTSWTGVSRVDDIAIGNVFYSYTHTTYIKEVMMFDRLLTQSEIQQYN